MSRIHTCGQLVLLCLALTACSEKSAEAPPVQTLRLGSGCDVREGCAGRDDTGLSVTVRMAPHRSALKPFNVSLSSNTTLESVTVSLEMQGMEMGQNRYRLLKTDAGSWQADITLPICTSGRSDWIAVFDVQAEGRHSRLSVPFTLGN
ncbi:hypothetical protein DFR30_0557 [Thiogranum longum]|uniref:Lipoprotein n=1 Tax=Thiogranum longum TaxID=1537524 RepID=A0A4R1HDH5_9GAMM|nr:hypothetical protein [Thiogranum longum]TCK17329.1 hypothetical protein DFR30_0557 [Thiogranum longum]